MPPRSTHSYQGPDGLERALVDLVRVGSAGHAAGVRQVASRLLRDVPNTVEDTDGFRSAIHEAMSGASVSSGSKLRFAGGELPLDSETNALVDVDPDPDGSNLVVSEGIAAQLDEIVEERRNSAKLAHLGVLPTRSVLLIGEPGVGKTLTARWLAQSIGVPLVSLDLASVVSSYLGSSGRNIKSVLKYAQTGPCVLLLDEFDAVAKRRDDDTDIGELKRIVNVLLVELDRWSAASLLVAATNHPQLLDPAIGRRFDRTLELSRPRWEELYRLLTQVAGPIDDATARLASDVLVGSTGSDITRLCETAQRRAVLRDSDPSAELLNLLLERGPSAGPDRDGLWSAVSHRLGMSARQIAARSNVSHPTVSAALKRVEANANG